jgi:UDP-2,3-diacylglucosamine pyrophosphatase LpxH
MLKITYMSDLHLEFWPYDEDRFIDNIVNKTPQSDLIILAGDIGVLAISYEYILSLLTKISVKGGTVVYVPKP